jgi:hypothetical protein
MRAESRSQFGELRAEDEALRDKMDKGHALLSGKIDATNARLDAITEKVGDLCQVVNGFGDKLNALFWVLGGLLAIGTFLVTVGKAVGWF